jgi:hypothetical protein
MVLVTGELVAGASLVLLPSAGLVLLSWPGTLAVEVPSPGTEAVLVT